MSLFVTNATKHIELIIEVKVKDESTIVLRGIQILVIHLMPR